MQDTQDARLLRAYVSLEGLSVGDAFGAFYEGASVLPYNIRTRTLIKPPWRWTDDTNMALSTVSVLRKHGYIHQDDLATSFAKHFDSSRGYGMSTRSLMGKISRGEHWKQAAVNAFGGTGSFGNGGAMRVAPVGAYFADDLGRVVEQAALSAEVTHSHPEGIAGAIAVAVAAAFAWRLRGNAHLDRQEFLETILPHIPESEVKENTLQARRLPLDTSVQQAANALGNGAGISAQDTVPFTLWCVGEMLANYEEAIWLTANGIGDTDTTCAIVGGIVALYTGVERIPSAWRESREPLPAWVFND